MAKSGVTEGGRESRNHNLEEETFMDVSLQKHSRSGCSPHFQNSKLYVMDSLRAKSTCGCEPWYLNRSNSTQCDTLGTICYEITIVNGTQDHELLSKRIS